MAKIIPDRTEARFQPVKHPSGLITFADVDYKLYCKLPKYAQDNEERTVTWLTVSKTIDGNHYTIEYNNGEIYEEYGWSNFLYCIKTRTQY